MGEGEYHKENLFYEIRYHNFVISHEETGRYLTFSFPLFNIEFNQGHTKQKANNFSTTNIFKATALTFFSFIVKE